MPILMSTIANIIFHSLPAVIFNCCKPVLINLKQIRSTLANLEVVNPKGRPKMFEELKTIKKQVHTTKMKEYMKTKYNTYQVVNNNLLTSDEFKEIEKCNLSDKIKNKIKMFTKSFIKKD